MPKSNEDNVTEQIEKALLKRAVGYSAKEITKEYQVNEGETVLVKKKVALKNIPPDITAAKMLLETFNKTTDLNSMTDNELEQEKKRLITLLKEGVKENENKKNKL
jgi:hypothetical protein